MPVRLHIVRSLDKPLFVQEKKGKKKDADEPAPIADEPPPIADEPAAIGDGSEEDSWLLEKVLGAWIFLACAISGRA